MDTIFNSFWDNYHVDETKFPHRRAATFREWNKRSPVTRQAMLDKILKEGGPLNKNPYFFVQDFPEPQPTFLRGDEPDAEVQVRYNGAYKICSRKTMQEFGLEWIRDW